MFGLSGTHLYQLVFGVNGPLLQKFPQVWKNLPAADMESAARSIALHAWTWVRL